MILCHIRWMHVGRVRHYSSLDQGKMQSYLWIVRDLKLLPEGKATHSSSMWIWWTAAIANTYTLESTVHIITLHSHDLAVSETWRKILVSASSWLQGVKPILFLSWEPSIYVLVMCEGSARSLESRTRRLLLRSMKGFPISFSLDWRMPFVCFVYARDVCDLIPSKVSPSILKTHWLEEPSLAPDTIIYRAKGSVWDLQHCHCPSRKQFLLVGLVYGNVGEHMPSCIYLLSSCHAETLGTQQNVFPARYI